MASLLQNWIIVYHWKQNRYTLLWNINLFLFLLIQKLNFLSRKACIGGVPLSAWLCEELWGTTSQWNWWKLVKTHTHLKSPKMALQTYSKGWKMYLIKISKTGKSCRILVFEPRTLLFLHHFSSARWELQSRVIQPQHRASSPHSSHSEGCLPGIGSSAFLFLLPANCSWG